MPADSAPAPAPAPLLARRATRPSPSPVRADDGLVTRALLSTDTCRRVEHEAAQGLPAHALMDRAGRAAARLARALVPHARRAWVAAGPGNNGGDGLVAARHLRAAGIDVVVSLLGDPARLPEDAAWAWREARAAGVRVLDTLPSAGEPAFDLALDALLGLGARRAPEGAMAEAVRRLGAGDAPVLAVDLPTGLAADTGAILRVGGSAAGAAGPCVRARWTLALLALKPGLFTAEGRARCGEVWFDALGVEPLPAAADAWLAGADALAAAAADRGAATHKGRFGDVHVVGGSTGMAGAATLAGRAAARAGAGRVFVHRLGEPGTGLDEVHPELMFRHPAPVPAAGDAGTWVAGCGGGRAIAAWLRRALPTAARLVVDADGLNAIAASPALLAALARRAASGRATVLTPHPLEAARLLGATAAQVQADRLGAARALAGRTGACVVLKGSGTVIDDARRPPVVNPTGDGRLATAGTGDVLAGWLGGAWAAAGGGDGSEGADAGPDAAHARAFRCAVATAWRHGRAAGPAGAEGAGRGDADPSLPVLASDLADRMARVDATGGLRRR